ncbi:MAG: hypothetical protein HOE90_21375 [Bacteriovoracaceae bacterium]|nr:hypothetical protein [Bacteriovoracaceae bacterium]
MKFTLVMMLLISANLSSAAVFFCGSSFLTSQDINAGLGVVDIVEMTCIGKNSKAKKKVRFLSFGPTFRLSIFRVSVLYCPFVKEKNVHGTYSGGNAQMGFFLGVSGAVVTNHDNSHSCILPGIGYEGGAGITGGTMEIL